MYEEREADLDRQDSLDTLEEEREVAKARFAFSSNMLADTKAEKYGPQLITLANSFYAYRRRKEQAQAQMGRSLRY